MHPETYFELIVAFLVEAPGEINLGSEQMAVPLDEALIRGHHFE